MICEVCGLEPHDECAFENCPLPDGEFISGALDGLKLYMCRPGKCCCGECGSLNGDR